MRNPNTVALERHSPRLCATILGTIAVGMPEGAHDVMIDAFASPEPLTCIA